MAFFKSNLPPKVGEDHVYFPTTLDQVIKPDGTRLSMDDLGGGGGSSSGGGSSEASDTAKKLSTPRNISLTGAVEGSVQFDGSKDVTMATTSKLTAGDVGAVPTTRKINNKSLTGDVTLSGSDISGVVTSVNGSSGAVTVATIKKWTGTLTENSAGYFNFPSGINQTNFISGNLTVTNQNFGNNFMHSLSVIYTGSAWNLFRVDGQDRSFGSAAAVIYYL